MGIVSEFGENAAVGAGGAGGANFPTTLSFIHLVCRTNSIGVSPIDLMR